MLVPIPLRRCQRVAPPAGGFYRVTDWQHPFDPPPAPPPLNGTDGRSGGRWDDPDGVFKTLYCASRPEAAIGEKLADFRLNPRVVQRIEAFFEEEPDDEFVDDQLLRPLDREDVDSFAWTLSWAPAEAGTKFLDVHHWRTATSTAPAVAELMIRHGLHDLDLRALFDEHRSFTRRLAGAWRAAATTPAGELLVRGLRYRSRLPPPWVCWALWAPLPLNPSEGTTEPLTIDHRHLRAAARKLGVQLAE